MTRQSEDARATWIAQWLSDAVQDLKHTFRGMRRDAGFTTFAILIAGLGIGAGSTIFSVVNALLLRQLPFANPRQLAWIANQNFARTQEWNTQVSTTHARVAANCDRIGFLIAEGVTEGQPVRVVTRLLTR